MGKIQGYRVLSFIKKAKKVLQKHKVKGSYYIKIHNINEDEATPISDVRKYLVQKWGNL